MRKLSIAVLIVGIAVAFALTGCGGGGGGGGTPTPPPPTGNTIVTGTVIDNRSPAHVVPGVVVTLGTLTQNTDASGKFSFNLGSNIMLLNFLPYPYNLVVSTRLLDQSQYPQVSVFYLGTGYPQDAGTGGAPIPIPAQFLAQQGVTVNLGTITVQFNDPTLPPPPPWP